jgi:hypothetical protein
MDTSDRLRSMVAAFAVEALAERIECAYMPIAFREEVHLITGDEALSPYPSRLTLNRQKSVKT